jgi:glycosyltransferase involved in cell wall biosynthesis
VNFEPPLVSVIIPCRNEAHWIRAGLESILENDYPKDRIEVLVVDGMSDDGTRSILSELAGRHPRIRLLDNPKKITPTALNIGIGVSRGSVIMRMDAHVAYPANYISALVGRLEDSGADNVGGVCVTRPATDTAMGRAIAVGMSHPLGVGNSYFRIGASKPRWVDTVPFGCYRRDVFDRIGVFDEQLVRNQDDEFNLRLIRRGGRILLTPEVVCDYYARDSLGKLWRMYYQYGYFKPLVVRKVGGVMTLRQLVPAVFVLSLVAAAVAAIWSWTAALLGAAIVLAYAAVILVAAAAAGLRRGVGCGLALVAVFPTLHLSYGLGYLRGVLDFMIFRRSRAGHGEATPLSR